MDKVVAVRAHIRRSHRNFSPNQAIGRARVAMQARKSLHEELAVKAVKKRIRRLKVAKGKLHPVFTPPTWRAIRHSKASGVVSVPSASGLVAHRRKTELVNRYEQMGRSAD